VGGGVLTTKYIYYLLQPDKAITDEISNL
jgi:hypothetical protein